MSKWSEIRCDFFDEEEEKYFVDAWKTDDGNEEGTVILTKMQKQMNMHRQ